MSERQAGKERSVGTTFERSPYEFLGAVKPLPTDEDALVEHLTDDQAHTFLATILDA